MSFFISSRDLEDDPFFGPDLWEMDNIANSFFEDPFGLIARNVMANAPRPHGRGQQNDLQMMPFGFPMMPIFNMNGLFTNFGSMANDPNCHSIRTSSIMTMASGPDGRPQVYQETMSTKTAPGGIKETKKTVCDSRTGVKKMAIGHHIGERAHIIEREKNLNNGDEEENQEFINLDEDEADSFNREWETRAQRHAQVAGGSSQYRIHDSRHRTRPEYKQLALPDPSTSQYSSRSRWAPSVRRSIKQLPTPKISGSTTFSCSSNRPSSSTSKQHLSSAVPGGSRKREHAPDSKGSNKRHVAPDNSL